MDGIILTVHGIGVQTPTYANTLFQKLRESVEREIDLSFIPVYWQDLTEPQQKELISKNKGLRWKILRKLFTSFAGDAINYQPTNGLNSVYYNVHFRLEEALRRASSLGKDIPIYIVAHSLGSIVVSNFIWDCQHPDSSGNEIYQPSDEAIEAIQNIKGIITMGSPLALWSLRCPGGGVPISLPPDSKWLNLFSKYDIISFPIKNINSLYQNNPNIEDKSIKLGSFWNFWSPMVHTMYWENDTVVREIVGVIEDTNGKINF